MYFLEKFAIKIRRSLRLSKLEWFWNLVRPGYELALKLILKKGLLRSVGNIDTLYVSHDFRTIEMPNSEELQWWRKLLQEIKENDTIADVGAYVGLFTILAAKRVSGTGKVFAFEPNPKSFALLKKHIELNKVTDKVQLFNLAIGNNNKPLTLISPVIECDPKSYVTVSAAQAGRNTFLVESRSLDELFESRKVDILKVDTEGYEIAILEGARNLLKRNTGYPRLIFVECHPYMWNEFGVNSEQLTGVLHEAGYKIEVPELPDKVALDDFKGHWVLFASKAYITSS